MVHTEQQHGELVEAVTRLEEKADLLVIGQRGEPADLAKLQHGSNFERVIRASVRPFLVASREFKPIEKMLVAYDGGPSVEKVFPFARENPLLRGLKCYLVRAGRIGEQAEYFLQEAAARLREAGDNVTTTEMVRTCLVPVLLFP